MTDESIDKVVINKLDSTEKLSTDQLKDKELKDENNEKRDLFNEESRFDDWKSDSTGEIYLADGLTLPVAIDVIQAAADDEDQKKREVEIKKEEEEGGDGDLNLRELGLIGTKSKDNKEFELVEEMTPVTLTSKKELFAWWLYYFAYSPVSAVAMILLIPLLLQDLARRAGHILGDPGRACSKSGNPTEICVLWTWGRWSVTPSAFAYYIIGISVASQALVFISVGALADYGKFRKGMLIICTWLGAFSAFSMTLAKGPEYIYLAAALTIMLNIFYGTSSVFYNAYLPLLVQNHPKYLSISTKSDPINKKSLQIRTLKPNTNQTLFSFTPQQRKLHKIGEKLSSFISTMGIAAGYCAGIILILGVIFYFQIFGTKGRAIQFCIAACGLWWLIFSCFALWHLKFRPGPPLPVGSNYLSFSWKKLGRTLQKCRRLPTTFSFLICYFFYSDGYNTMGSAAILIARQSLNVGIEKLTICALIAPICALFGTISFFFIQKTFKISTKQMLIWILCSMGCIPIYCALGLISNKIGLRNEWEIYAITSIYGLIIGAAQSFSRVLFAELIPIGDESEFFSLYAITDKGSAFLGPMVIAILSDYFNEPRFGLIFLAVLILAPIPLIISKVNLIKGKQECTKFSQEQAIN